MRCLVHEERNNIKPSTFGTKAEIVRLPGVYSPRIYVWVHRYPESVNLVGEWRLQSRLNKRF